MTTTDPDKRTYIDSFFGRANARERVREYHRRLEAAKKAEKESHDSND